MKKTPPKKPVPPPIQHGRIEHDRRGHVGSNRGRKDLSGRKHTGYGTKY